MTKPYPASHETSLVEAPGLLRRSQTDQDIWDMSDVVDVSQQRFETPSLRRRMACWLYEGMLLFGVVFIAGYLFSTLSQTKNAMDNRHALQAFIFVVFGIYFGWLWSKGQTLAMKTWHIRVVDLQGQPLTQGRALIRYLWCWLWVLPPLLASWLFEVTGGEATVITLGWVAVWAILSRFHPRQQFWHDALAGTQLVTALPRKK